MTELRTLLAFLGLVVVAGVAFSIGIVLIGDHWTGVLLTAVVALIVWEKVKAR